MNILGIDPGFGGGLAVVSDSGMLIDYTPMPIIEAATKGGKKRKHLDIPMLISWIELCDVEFAIIEKVSAMPKQGVVSMFRFGEQYGALQGVLCTLRISHRFITPQAWKKVILAGYDKADKNSSLLYVKRRWPVSKIEGTKVQKQGQADAICLALCGTGGGEKNEIVNYIVNYTGSLSRRGIIIDE